MFWRLCRGPKLRCGLLRCVVAVGLGVLSLTAATIPKITAVVNAANYQPGIVSGGWATILGTGLSNTTRSWTAADFLNGALPQELDYISVTVNGRPAYIGYISPTQINVLIPDDPTLGQSTVQAAGQLLQSNFFLTNKTAYSPALFQLTPRYPSAEHADGSLIGPVNVLPGAKTTPAHPNETIQLYGTGFGPANPVVPTGSLFNVPAALATPVSVTIGGVAADAFGYLIMPGLYQLNVTIPPLPDGDAEISLAINGVNLPSGMFLSVAN